MAKRQTECHWLTAILAAGRTMPAIAGRLGRGHDNLTKLQMKRLIIKLPTTGCRSLPRRLISGVHADIWRCALAVEIDTFLPFVFFLPYLFFLFKYASFWRFMGLDSLTNNVAPITERRACKVSA
jgi:hypothetical protein